MWFWRGTPTDPSITAFEEDVGSRVEGPLSLSGVSIGEGVMCCENAKYFGDRNAGVAF
jgi:hypothetical protein